MSQNTQTVQEIELVDNIKKSIGKKIIDVLSNIILVVLGIFIVYMLIFLFGTQVMRGVIEEKSSRIIEVIISSVKPFQLMMGKILGIAAVSIVQLILWGILTFGLVTVASSLLLDKPESISNSKDMITNAMETSGAAQQVVPDSIASNGFAGEMMSALSNVNFALIIGGFIFFFLGGYLLYAAMFAAVGACCQDSSAQHCQFL